MGYMKHHAIIVTTWRNEILQKAHKEAKNIFSFVSDISPETVNGYSSFFIPPDGSKEGWDISVLGDDKKNIFRLVRIAMLPRWIKFFKIRRTILWGRQS